MLPSSTARACRLLFGAGLMGLASAFCPSSAHSITGAWTGDFSIPAFDGYVRACAIYNGSYYVGGDFDWAAGIRTEHVARWTGSEWAQVGGGLRARVQRLTVWGSKLVAATTFADPPHGPVVQFDGVSWQPIGPELHGEADALLVHGTDLYAAGSLLLVGFTNGNRVMRWDGSAWQPVGGVFDGRILALAIYQGELYAAGEFLFAEDTFVSRIARWDGAHWQPVGGGTNGGDGVRVSTLAVYQDRLIAGGYFTSMGPVTGQSIAAWDGTTWEALPNVPEDIWVNDLQAEGGLLHAAGLFQVPNLWAAGLVTFDGQIWSPPDPHPSWTMQDVAIGDGNLIAVGLHSHLAYGLLPTTTWAPNRDVVVRDATWHALVSWKSSMRGLLGPAYTHVDALHIHKGELYAGGYFYYAASPPSWRDAWGVARWGGDRWEPVGDGQLRGWVQEIGSWNDQLVVGSTGFNLDIHSSCVAGWDGTSWTNLGGYLVGNITGFAEWQGALVAAGGVRLPDQTEWSGVAINRGSGWEILGSRLVTDQTSINDVATFEDELYIAGSNLVLSGAGPHTLARWDGSAWVGVPNSPGGIASCLLPRHDGLWVGFLNYSPFSEEGSVWRLDRGSRHDMGPLNGPVLDLIDDGDEVFAGGAMLAGNSSSTVAWWDGDQWHAIDGAPNQSVLTLAVLGTDLWAGGWLRHTGDRQAEGIARWSFQRESIAPGIARFETPWPTPARDHVAFRFTMPRQGRARIQLYDLSGALVATPVDEPLAPGTYERAWTIPRNRIRAGIYFARLELPGEFRSAKVVIAR